MTFLTQRLARRQTASSWLVLMLAASAFALGLGSAPSRASNQEYRKGSLEIEHPYATPTAPGQPHGALFIREIKNRGTTADQLIGGRVSIAKSVEVHQMIMDNNVMKMREIPGIEVPAKGKVSMKQGSKEGYHLMLMNLNAPLKEGDRLKATLIFKQAGELEVDVIVEKSHHGHGHRH
ncbi:MAG: copper chaperone PCu(A)C [Burkholderiaceae bacterium]|nr:copper chaperone PCu(A)C [Burkholderiaceae bacterium]